MTSNNKAPPTYWTLCCEYTQTCIYTHSHLQVAYIQRFHQQQNEWMIFYLPTVRNFLLLLAH